MFELKRIMQKVELTDYLFVLTAIIYLIVLYSALGTLLSLPSPIYGGDYYHSRGAIENYVEGGGAFKHPAMLNETAIYFPLYTSLVGSFAKLFSLDAFEAMKYFNLFYFIVALIVTYLFFSLVLKNKSIGLGLTLMYIAPIPIWKYLQFTIYLMIPLFLLSLYLFFEKRNVYSSIFCGVSFGLVGLSHSVAFVMACIFFGIFSAYFLIGECVERKNSKYTLNKETFKKEIKQKIIFISIISLIALLISLTYWYEPVFKFHGKTLNPLTEYGIPTPEIFKNKIHLFLDPIKGMFFNFSDLLASFSSLLALSGFICLLLIKKYSQESKFIILMIFSGFVASNHFLFGVNFVPSYMAVFSFKIIAPLLIGFSIYVLLNKFKNQSIYIILLFLILSAMISFSNYKTGYLDDKWAQNGKRPIENHFLEAEKWVKDNVNVNDVFISTNELSFALNGLTGRKFQNIRIGVAGGWTDIFSKMKESAIILYGDDDSEREELIKKNNIKYLYWNYYWLQSEFQFDAEGKLVNVFDPLFVWDTEKNREDLKKVNITFDPQHTWIDAAARGEAYKKYDILYIYPSYFNYTHPWNKKLDKYLKEVWRYEEGENNLAKIYEINI